MVKSTVALTAIAMTTERLRFGDLVTPLPWRQPAKFARETVTLEDLSAGRLTVGILKAEFKNIGEPPDFNIQYESSHA